MFFELGFAISDVNLVVKLTCFGFQVFSLPVNFGFFCYNGF